MASPWPSTGFDSRPSEIRGTPCRRATGCVGAICFTAHCIALVVLTSCRPALEQPSSETAPREATTPSPAIEPLLLDENPWHQPGECFEIAPFEAGGPVATAIEAGAGAPVFVLPVALAAGEVLDLAVEEGFDVAVSLVHRGETLLHSDLPVDDLSTERLIFIAHASTVYEVHIEPLEITDEPTRAHIRALGVPTADDRHRSRAAQRLFEADRAGDDATRVELLLQAAEDWRRGGNTLRRSLALHRAGRLDARVAQRLDRARQSLSSALDLFLAQDDLRYQALTLYWLGKVAGRQDDLVMAIHWSERALEAMKTIGSLREQAVLANDLAGFHLRRGRVHTATELYFEALGRWEGLANLHQEAVTRTNLGICYVSRGALRPALDQYRRAIALLETTDHPSDLAFALTRLGDVLLELEGPATARPILDRALSLRRSQQERRGEAITLNSLAKVALEEHRPRQALEALRQSQATLRQLDDTWSEAVVENGLGRAQERLGQSEPAEQHFLRARELAQKVAHRHAEAEALFGLARLARQRGRLEDARHQIEQAIDRLEHIRDLTERQDLRSTFLAIKQDYYDFLIDLLAESHRAEPQAGHDAAAFLVAERFRARSLLDTFSHVSDNLEQTLDPQLLERLESLRRRFDALRRLSATADHRATESTGNLRGSPTGHSLREVEKDLEQLRQTEAALTRAYRRYDTWTRPPLVGPDFVRQRLLDDDTLILSFHLGERRSYVWALERDRMIFRDDLPPRDQLEEAALEVFEGLQDSHFQTSALAARLTAERFADQVLDPIADLLDGQRLVISAPGVLEYVPFAALPDPRPGVGGGAVTSASLLADRHEIVRLPSLSVLAALRRAQTGREPPPGALAIVADPVFGTDDPRLASQPAAAEPAKAEPLPRLIHSRREAETMAELADGPTFLATGFDASRQTVLEGPLADFRIVHFATHGTFDTELPELSSLVLSRFDPEGRPIDGELRAYEIFTLHLPADLVVLSACRTALGREIRGEGLVGLARGFMEAGARRVMVSLWDVDDQATARFMHHFYRALFAGEPPTAALRSAQVTLAQSAHWSSPHYWAGFVLLGDWR